MLYRVHPPQWDSRNVVQCDCPQPAQGAIGKREGAGGVGGLRDRTEMEGAAAEHGGGHAIHDRLSLHVQVSVHLV